MDALSTTSLSGLHASRLGMDVAASNIANLSTPGFHRRQAVTTTDAAGGVDASVRTLPQEGPALEEDVVGLLAARNGFLANLAVFRTAAATSRSLLDVFA